jgi:hypothetical protein
MIENVEDLGAELNVESLRDPLYVIVFEQGEIQRCDAWTHQDVAPCVAAKVKARQSWEPTRSVKSRVLGVVDRDLVSI